MPVKELKQWYTLFTTLNATLRTLWFNFAKSSSGESGVDKSMSKLGALLFLEVLPQQRKLLIVFHLNGQTTGLINNTASGTTNPFSKNNAFPLEDLTVLLSLNTW